MDPRYNPLNSASFEFTQDLAFGSWEIPLITAVVYLTAVFVTYQLERTFGKWQLDWIVAGHNMILCVWSLIMLLGMLHGEYERIFLRGLTPFTTLFQPQGTQQSGTLEYWYYIYYISKYYELLDTILATLRGKPLTVLHVFHHTIMVILMWCVLAGEQVIFVIGGSLNCTVHVVMYYYYARRTVDRKWNPWWKSLLTTGQIIQFLIVMFFLGSWAVYSLYLGIPPMPRINFNDLRATADWNGPLVGNLWVHWLSIGIDTAFLTLFSNFFIQTYIKKKDNRSKAKKN